MGAVTDLLNKIPELSYSELETINETIKKIMIEKRRDEIKRNADESLQLYKEGKLKGFSDPQKMTEWLMAADETN